MGDLFGNAGVDAMHGNHAHYPHKPARGKRDTSAKAADSVADKVSPMQQAILKHLDGEKLTTPELAERMGKLYRTIQPRTSELAKLCKIRDSGQRRPDPDTGKPIVVWELVE